MSRLARRTLIAAALLLGSSNAAGAQPVPENRAEALGEDVHNGVAEHHAELSVREVFGGNHSTEFWGAVVNFVLLLLVLRKLGAKPLASFLTTRRDDVEKGMKEAAEIKAKAEAVYKEYSERLQTMDVDMAKLRKDITEAAAADKKRIIAEAEQSAARVRSETDALVEQRARELTEAIRGEVVTASVAAAEEVLKKVLSGGDQERLAQQFEKNLTQMGARS